MTDSLGDNSLFFLVWKCVSWSVLDYSWCVHRGVVTSQPHPTWEVQIDKLMQIETVKLTKRFSLLQSSKCTT